jgi:hypothetical protein
MAELADRHRGKPLSLVVIELHSEPVLYPHRELGEREGFQIGAGRAEHGVVIDVLDAVVHVRQ